MLYYLTQWCLEAAKGTTWEQMLSPLRVFRYITFRTAGAAITALLLTLWIGPGVIAWLKRIKFGQEYDDRAQEIGDLKTRLLSKRGTPTEHQQVGFASAMRWKRRRNLLHELQE